MEKEPQVSPVMLRPLEKGPRRKRSRRAICCCCTATSTTTTKHHDGEEGAAGVMFDGESDDERAEVERKIAALQRIVPGGESLEVDRLFEETADYILALEGKVIAMKLLANLFQGLQKEETKVGG
ncbi:hypothetical protein H6P81_013623 [Aristolochia fimbriata]|uniref:Uncharacterized protein n=1 Tax=Aristolochia fimbriata TaxID=158543 RepID=A0AAV7EF76_ARIFI|nr:hypothetical protein H6P81_013623 [Aristolochia fimbriata]